MKEVLAPRRRTAREPSVRIKSFSAELRFNAQFPFKHLRAVCTNKKFPRHSSTYALLTAIFSQPKNTESFFVANPRY
jgi:hypothetical protein